MCTSALKVFIKQHELNGAVYINEELATALNITSYLLMIKLMFFSFHMTLFNSLVKDFYM